MGKRWDRIRAAGGYGLFAAAVGYALYTVPSSAWQLRPLWLVVTVVILLLLIVMQTLQLMVFLKAHGVSGEIRWTAMFAVKRGLLNAILPARGGTLVMMRAMTARYPVRWQDYLLFNMIAAAVSMLWSAAVLIWLLLDMQGIIIFLLTLLLVLYMLGRVKSIPYRKNLPAIILIAGAIYAVFLLVFWSLLHGMGINMGFGEAMYFTVALNFLAQISITPGNLGVREWVMGALAPYLALPLSLGILAGGIFHVLRLVVYGLILMIAGTRSFSPEYKPSK